MTYTVLIKTPTLDKWIEYVTGITTKKEAEEIAAQAKEEIKVKVVRE